MSVGEGTTVPTQSLGATLVTPSIATASVGATLVAGSPVVVQAAGYTASTGPLAPRIVTPTPAATTEPGGPVLAGPPATKNAYEAKHKDDPQLNNLKTVRKECGLKHVPVKVACEQFKASAVDGQLSRAQFLAVYATLLDAHGLPEVSEDVKHAVFDLFDRDDNDIVDMMELICGTALLCKGNEDSKVEAVFNMFDDNGDGFVTMDEMFKFLSTVFKVVCTPNVMQVVNDAGVEVESAEDMASSTTWECFQTADLNHDGKLSLEEFKKWFYAPRNDPALLFGPVKQMLT